MNDNVATLEARRLAMALAKHCKEYAYLLPLDLDFPGLRVHVAAERIVKKDDTLPVFGRHDEDNGIAD